MTNETYTILIVDDEEANLKLLSLFLTCNQYTLHTAGNGKDAIELAKRIRPDLVLLDVMMPEMDGYEVCWILKGDEATKGIPVIFMTALQEIGDETSGFEAGVVDFISKPLNALVVQARVWAHLSLNAALAAGIVTSEYDSFEA